MPPLSVHYDSSAAKLADRRGLASAIGFDARFVHRMRLFAHVCAWLAIAIAAMVLAGWIFDIASFKAVHGEITMKTNAAIALLLAGIGLEISALRAGGQRWLPLLVIASVGTASIGAATLSQHLFGWNLGIDELLATEQPGATATMSPNRMGPHASLSFILLGMAMLLASRRHMHAAQTLALIVVTFAFTALVGYVYDVQELYGVARYSGIALHTSIALLLLGLGMLACTGDSGGIAVFSTVSSGSILARRLLPVAVLVPVILGWLRVRGQELGYYGTAFGTSLLVVATVLILALVILRNAWALNRVELTAEEIERRFRSMADQAPVLVWVAQREGKRAWFNRPWQDFTGAQLDDDLNYGWVKRLHPADAVHVLQRYRAAVSKCEPYEMEYRLCRRDGEYRWLLETGVPRTLTDGQYAGHVGSCVDITDRRQAQAELERLYNSETHARGEAERATRLRDEFLATVSHELRTPLNAILGWSHLLVRGTLDRDTSARAVDAILRNARTQAQLIEDLLDVSRIIAGRLRLDLRDVSLPEIIRSAAEAVRPAAEAKGVALHLDLEAQGIRVRADPMRLQQVLWNLLSNAIKFTPEGGRVSVSVAGSNSHVEVSVTDTGEGISPEFLPHVFDRFQQADASYTRRHGGLGLGLSITRHLVEMHGGVIRAQSAGVGHGAMFIVRLPLTRAARPSSAAPEPEAMVPSTAAGSLMVLIGLKLLVVDDQADTLVMMRSLLESFGASVACTASVAEAVPLVRTWRPDIVICDVGMPDEDGYSLLRQIRALPEDEGGGTPAIACTGYVRVEERERALAAGFEMFVAKPVIASELVAAISAVREKKERESIG